MRSLWLDWERYTWQSGWEVAGYRRERLRRSCLGGLVWHHVTGYRAGYPSATTCVNKR